MRSRPSSCGDPWSPRGVRPARTCGSSSTSRSRSGSASSSSVAISRQPGNINSRPAASALANCGLLQRESACRCRRSTANTNGAASGRPPAWSSCIPRRCARMGTRHCRPTTSRRSARSPRSEEHTSELQSLRHLVCRLLLEKKNQSKFHLPSAAEALVAIHKDLPALVFTDLKLLHLDGTARLEQVKNLYPHLPLLPVPRHGE